MNTGSFIPQSILPPRGAAFTATLSAKTLDGAANIMSRNLGVEKPLAVMTLLGAATAVIHGLLDVTILDGGISPTSKFIIIMAPPGSGKTRCVDEAYKTHRAFQQLQIALHNEQVSEQKVKLSIWRKQRAAILDLYPSQFDSSLEGDDSANDMMSQLAIEVEKQLIEHEKKRPKPAGALKLFGEDATIESIHAILANYPVHSLVSSEGGIVTRSRAFQNEEHFNSFWSGSPVMISRKTGESYNLTDPRLSLLLSIQTDKVKPLVDGKQASGFSSRGMYFMTDDKKPHLSLPTYIDLNETEGCSLDRFHHRMDQLSMMNKARFDDPSLPRQCMGWSPEAASLFQQITYDIKRETEPGGHFANVLDHASRLPEQIARVAAVLQFLEDPDQDISAALLMDALNICMYCSDCYVKLFDTPPREVRDARMLSEWLNLNMRSRTGLRLVNKNSIRQFGPNALRGMNRLNHALMVLQQEGKINMFIWGKQHIIDLYPQVPIDAAQIAFLLGSPKKVG